MHEAPQQVKVVRCSTSCAPLNMRSTRQNDWKHRVISGVVLRKPAVTLNICYSMNCNICRVSSSRSEQMLLMSGVL